MRLAEIQAAYDGACMVYGRNEARLFLNRPDPTGHAYVRTFTTDGTSLNTYAHYASESEGQVKYHQCPTSTSLLIESYEDFKKSRRRLRNLQDDAEETSKKLRDELKEKWLANHRSPVAPSVQVSTANNGYTSPNGLTFPPQSSEDTSLPLESSEDIGQSNVRGHRRTLRTRKPVAIVHARKTRRKL